MPVSDAQRARSREWQMELEYTARKLQEFQVRLDLAMPTVLAQTIVRTMRGKLGINQEDFAQAFGVHSRTVVGWESGEVSPTFSAVVNLLIAEFVLLKGSTPSEMKEYNPREGLLGRILACGALDREEIRHALERLGEVMLTAPKLPLSERDETEDPTDE